MSPRARSQPFVFAAVAALVVLAAALVLVRRSPNEHPAETATAPSSPVVVGHGKGTPAPAPAAATRAARRFTLGYLTLIYGRGRPADVPAASPQLRGQLADNTGRIPPAQRGRRARIVTLRLDLTDATTAQGTATIDDGRIAPWPLAMSLHQAARGRWEVTSLGD